MSKTDQFKSRLLLKVRLRVEHIVVGVTAFFFVSYVLVLLLDVLNVGDWGEWFITSASYLINHGRRAPAFLVLFADLGPVEWFQWFMLSIVIFVGSYQASTLKDYNAHASMFWLLLSIGCIFMLVEDAGNLRHRMGSFLNLFSPVLPEGTPLILVWEMIYFSILAALPVYAFIKYSKDLSVRVWWCVVVGFMFYGLAAGMSVSSGLGWYDIVGDWIMSGFSDQMLREDIYRQNLGFWFMDTLVEESIELIGATGLASGALWQYNEIE